MLNDEYVIHTDGGCDPNPGGVACWAFVVRRKDDQIIYAKYGCLGSGAEMTNNLAEYTAMLEALRFATLHLKSAKIMTDSKLVVDHLSGHAQCNANGLKSVYDRCKKILSSSSSIKLGWVPRERNREADALTKKAYAFYQKSHGRVSRLSLDVWYVDPPPQWER